MNSLNITKIEIEQFKKIQQLTLLPEKGANLFFGAFRSGKTSLCEFIQFVLYGSDFVALPEKGSEDAIGQIDFVRDDEAFTIKRRVIGKTESYSICHTDSQEEVQTPLSPGEFLTGLDAKMFSLLCYFKQARDAIVSLDTPLNLLARCADAKEETKDVYRDARQWKEEEERYRNGDHTGSLDLLLQKEEELKQVIEAIPAAEEERDACRQELDAIREKSEENEHRCVLIKADMATFTDDMKLSRNRENAKDLAQKIQAKEKKLNLLTYEVTTKIGKLSKDKLEELREDYNRLSLAETSLNEARMRLSASEDNLAFHEKIFTGNDNTTHFAAESARIKKYKLWRLAFRILGVLLIGGAAVLGVLIPALDVDWHALFAGACALGLLGIALEIISTIFTSSIRKILVDNKKESLPQFQEFYERLLAHEKTAQTYRDQILSDRADCKAKKKDKDQAANVIRQKISALGWTEDAGEMLSFCDEIIEANDTLYDLEEELSADRTAYEKILRSDLTGETLTVSPAFATLKKELLFLLAQNESLDKRRTIIQDRLSAAEASLSVDADDLKKRLEEIKKQKESEQKKFERAGLNFALAAARRERFESDLKEELAFRINNKLSFLLQDGESFQFDDQFHLCYHDQNTYLPLEKMGGGQLYEFGTLALRLSLGEILNRDKIPMIFDDTLTNLAPAAAKELYTYLTGMGCQFFIAASSQETLDLCGDSAKVFTL